MSLDALTAARDELAAVINQSASLVEQHKTALEKVDAAVQALKDEASRPVTKVDLQALIARMA